MLLINRSRCLAFVAVIGGAVVACSSSSSQSSSTSAACVTSAVFTAKLALSVGSDPSCPSSLSVSVSYAADGSATVAALGSQGTCHVVCAYPGDGGPCAPMASAEAVTACGVVIDCTGGAAVGGSGTIAQVQFLSGSPPASTAPEQRRTTVETSGAGTGANQVEPCTYSES